MTEEGFATGGDSLSTVEDETIFKAVSGLYELGLIHRVYKTFTGGMFPKVAFDGACKILRELESVPARVAAHLTRNEAIAKAAVSRMITRIADARKDVWDEIKGIEAIEAKDLSDDSPIFVAYRKIMVFNDAIKDMKEKGFAKKMASIVGLLADRITKQKKNNWGSSIGQTT